MPSSKCRILQPLCNAKQYTPPLIAGGTWAVPGKGMARRGCAGASDAKTGRHQAAPQQPIRPPLRGQPGARSGLGRQQPEPAQLARPGSGTGAQRERKAQGRAWQSHSAAYRPGVRQNSARPRSPILNLSDRRLPLLQLPQAQGFRCMPYCARMGVMCAPTNNLVGLAVSACRHSMGGPLLL